MISNNLIVALDTSSLAEAVSTIEKLDGLVSFYKIGLELLVGGQTKIIFDNYKNIDVFLDLKFPNDIPQTVKRTVTAITNLNIKFLTLSDGFTKELIKTAKEARGDNEHPKLLFVPALSSYNDDYTKFIESCNLALSWGVDGFIASGYRINTIRDHAPKALIVSPGIRLTNQNADDHKHFCSPSEAIRRGANYIVVGRPITQASNKREAAQEIIEDINNGVLP